MLVFFTWFFAFLRVGAFLTVLPLFGTPNVPVRIRTTIAAMLAVFMVPAVPNPIDVGTLSLVGLVLLIAHEIIVGLFLGFVSKLIFFCVQLAGHFISTEIGLQTSTLITPVDSVPVDVPGAVLNLLGLMLFLTLDIHHAVILAFQQTYQFVPLGGATLKNALFDNMLSRLSGVFLLAVQIASPLIAVSFLIGIVMAMLGRAVPQMNVFFESFTVRLFAGLIVFGFAINLAAQRISDFLKQVPKHILEVGQLLGLIG
jgi:flagellar biosynthesis protein FliR